MSVFSIDKIKCYFEAIIFHYSRTDTKSMESKDVLLVDIQTIFCSAAVSEFRWACTSVIFVLLFGFNISYYISVDVTLNICDQEVLLFINACIHMLSEIFSNFHHFMLD